MLKSSIVPLTVAALCVAAAARAPSGLADQTVQLTEHTARLAKGAPRPSATLADVAWLVGDWVGEAFGDRFEEVWNPASAGAVHRARAIVSTGRVAAHGP